MRYFRAFLLVIASSGIGFSPARADDNDRALAVVDQAIRAHGGESALAKTRNIHRTGKGSWILFGKENPFTIDTTMQLPDRLRDAAEVEINGQKMRVVTVVNGEQAWQALGSGNSEVEKDRIVEFRDEAFVMWLATLRTLKDKSVTLALLPQANVLGKPVAVVKATASNRPEVTLYFDKQSGLLVKIERSAKEVGLKVKKEYFLADHKDFAGVKLPTRWLEVVNGDKRVDLTITAYDFPSQLESRTFEKP